MNAMTEIDLRQQQGQAALYNPGKLVEAIVSRSLRSVKASLSAKGKSSNASLMAGRVLEDLATKLDTERKSFVESIQDCPLINFPIEAQLIANEIKEIRSCIDGGCFKKAATMLVAIRDNGTVHNKLADYPRETVQSPEPS